MRFNNEGFFEDLKSWTLWNSQLNRQLHQQCYVDLWDDSNLRQKEFKMNEVAIDDRHILTPIDLILYQIWMRIQ